MFTSKPCVDHLGKDCMHMFIPLECCTPNDPETSWRISCPSLPSTSYDWVQYHIPHVSVLFHHQVGALTEVDLRPSAPDSSDMSLPQLHGHDCPYYDYRESICPQKFGSFGTLPAKSLWNHLCS